MSKRDHYNNKPKRIPVLADKNYNLNIYSSNPPTFDNPLNLDGGGGGGAAATPSGVAGGDLGGFYPNPTVDNITLGSDTWGDVYYRGPSGLSRLAAGISGQFLRTMGTGADPMWATVTQGGGSGSDNVGLVSIAHYGAVGDGVTDSRNAINAAITAAVASGIGGIFIPAGTYAIYRDDVPGTTNIDSITLNNISNFRITGTGPGSVIKKIGSAHGRDWTAIRVKSCTNLWFDHFTVDGNRRGITEPDEQDHAFNISPSGTGATAASGINFFALTVKDTFGDGIRSVGAVDAPVLDMHIVDVNFFGCKRSAIGIQRSTHRFIIDNCYMDTPGGGIGDQRIDFEPTGNGPVGPCMITNNYIDQSHGQGDIAVTLTGNSPSEPTDFCIFANNTIISGTMNTTLNVRNMLFESNIVYGPESTNDAANFRLFQIQKGGENVLITGNHFINQATTSGNMINMQYFTSTAPNYVKITNNFFRSAASLSTAFDFSSVRNLDFSNNTFYWSGTSSGIVNCMNFRATELPGENLTFHNNGFISISGGSWDCAFRFSTSDFDIGHVSIIGNHVRRANFGVEFADGPGTYTTYPTIASNHFDVFTNEVNGASNVGLYCISGNNSKVGVRTLVGTVDPTVGLGVESGVGSTIIKTNGTSLSTIRYLKVGSGKTSWTGG